MFRRGEQPPTEKTRSPNERNYWSRCMVPLSSRGSRGLPPLKNPYPDRGVMNIVGFFIATSIVVGFFVVPAIIMSWFDPAITPHCSMAGLPCNVGGPIFTFLYGQSILFNIMWWAELFFGGVIRNYQRSFFWKCVATLPFILAIQGSLLWQMKYGWWI